jgi:hypothetical protein
MPKFIIKFDNTFFDEDDQMDGFEIDSKDIEDLPKYEGVAVHSLSASADDGEDDPDEVKLFISVNCIIEAKDLSEAEFIANNMSEKNEFTDFLKEVVIAAGADYDVEDTWEVLEVEHFDDPVETDNSFESKTQQIKKGI